MRSKLREEGFILDCALRRDDGHSGEGIQQEGEKQRTDRQWSWPNKLQKSTSSDAVSSSKAPEIFHKLSEQATSWVPIFQTHEPMGDT